MRITLAMTTWMLDVGRAIKRARYSIITVAAAYCISILIGIVMVHDGNAFALNYRDRLVNQAAHQNPAALAENQGNHLRAAVLDFAGNLVLGAVPKTISGLAIILPYPWIVHQGWVGGIVSVRADHSSRFNNIRSAVYYLLTLVLQVIPYSLAIGAGINAGLALFRPQPYYQGEKWFKILPKEALRDIGWIYTIVAPLFLAASLWEFMSPWNI
jgi:hypothetical protein